MKYTFVTLLGAFLCGAVCTAAPVTPEEACLAAQRWIATKATVRAEMVTPIKDGEGNTVAYCVPTEEGGTLLTSTDTAFAPILGYTLNGDWSNLPEGHPLRMLLTQMGATQREALKQCSLRTRTASSAENAFAENEAEWARLLMPASKLSRTLRGVPEEIICIAWENDWNGTGKFDHWHQLGYNNYYRPDFGTDLEKTNLHALYNRDCPKVKATFVNKDNPAANSTVDYLANTGCIATAGATIQQFFRFPQTITGGTTCQCEIVDTEYEVDLESQKLKPSFKSRPIKLTTTQATYNWDLLDRNWKEKKENESGEDPGEAVRNLTNAVSYNTSVLVETEYGNKSAGTNSLSTIGKLTQAFKTMGFTNASCFLRVKVIDSIGDIHSVRTNTTPSQIEELMPTVEFLNRYVYPSLIANRPVVLSLEEENKKDSGHAVVAAGFFVSGKTRWTRILWGWGGTGNGKFNLEEVLAPAGFPGKFNVLNGAISMISSPNTKYGDRHIILAGRVVDSEGKGVKDATVTCYYDSTPQSDRTTTTEEGWFALPLSPMDPLSPMEYKGKVYATYVLDDKNSLVSEMKRLDLTPYKSSFKAVYAPDCISSIPTLETFTLQPSKKPEDNISILIDPSNKDKLTLRALNEMIKFVEHIKDKLGEKKISKINIQNISSIQQGKSGILLANDIFSILKPDSAEFEYEYNSNSETLTFTFDVDLTISKVNVTEAVPQGRQKASACASLTLELKGGGEQCVFDDAITVTLLASETLDFTNAKSLPITSVELEERRLTLYFPPSDAPTHFLKVLVSGPTQ